MNEEQELMAPRQHWGNTDAGRIIAAGVWVLMIALAIWIVCSAVGLLMAVWRWN